MNLDIQNILRSGESDQVEFKSSFNREVIESACAFANHKGGSVLIGVDDSANIVGVSFGAETAQRWLNEIKQNTSPAIIPDIEEFHRDYMSPTDIQIKIFDQSILFFNPGKLYGGLTIEELDTDTYQARTRNKLIAEAFYLTCDTEKYGSGFRRIRSAIADYPTMQFSYRESGDGFISELQYKEQKIQSRSFATTQETTQEINLGEVKQKILHQLRENPKMTRQELTGVLGKSDATIKDHIAQLKALGLLERVGSTKGGLWHVKS